MAKEPAGMKVTKTVDLKADDPKFGSLFNADHPQVVVTYENGNSQVLDKPAGSK